MTGVPESVTPVEIKFGGDRRRLIRGGTSLPPFPVISQNLEATEKVARVRQADRNARLGNREHGTLFSDEATAAFQKSTCEGKRVRSVPNTVSGCD
jgi:hypothetical protein